MQAQLPNSSKSKSKFHYPVSSPNSVKVQNPLSKTYYTKPFRQPKPVNPLKPPKSKNPFLPKAKPVKSITLNQIS